MTNLRLNVKEQSKITSGKTDCAVILVGSDLKLDSAAKAVAKSSSGLVDIALAGGDFKGSAGESLMLRTTGEASRVLVLGIGDAADRQALRKACGAMAKSLLSSNAKDATVHLSAVRGLRKELSWFSRTLAHALTYHGYRYTHTVSSPKPASALRRVTLSVTDAASAKVARAAAATGAATAAGTNLARELANRPGNYCTPEHLAKEARRLARSSDKASCKVLNEKAMAELGMHSLLSVTAGTATPAKLIVLEYLGGKRGDAPHALVGKGITFDSGGISLKPGAKMDEMKFDMGGAASVLGTMQSVIDMKLPLNVVAIIAAAENMPSGTATKPGDVVTSMAGITIEVLNTDAEGRLVLCDALTFAAKYKPATVVDIATLTGACVVALGSQASALYANDEALAADLLSAGEESYDRAWRMPLWDEYQKQLDSNFADVANIGGPAAGSVTAACFLARFTKEYRWAHLDIAGSAWDSSPKGATGRPVGLLTQYLCDRAGIS